MEIITPPSLNSYDYANIFTAYEDDDGLQFFNLFNTIIIDGEIDPTLYTEEFYNSADGWYALSQKHYGTYRLYWTILLANGIVNPFEDIVAGTKIKILNPSVISNILNQMAIK